MTGQYHKVSSNDSALRAALTDFFNTYPLAIEEPVAGRLYETQNVRLLRRYFNEALERGRAVYVEGAPGCQKTFVVQHLIAELNRREIAKNGTGRRAYYIYCRAGIGPLDLAKRVAEAAGSAGIGNIDRILRNLRFDFSGRRALLVFDEAQHLSVECFEVVRELLDRPPYFGLMFTGSHELKSFFVRNSHHLEQWQSRFYKGESLPGISEEEARAIVAGETEGRLKGEHAERLIKRCRATALSSQGNVEYISARRLFLTLADLKSVPSTKYRVPSAEQEAAS